MAKLTNRATSGVGLIGPRRTYPDAEVMMVTGLDPLDPKVRR